MMRVVKVSLYAYVLKNLSLETTLVLTMTYSPGLFTVQQG